jgi:hypothetical protein
MAADKTNRPSDERNQNLIFMEALLPKILTGSYINRVRLVFELGQ